MIRVKTINGLHYLFRRDVSLRQVFTDKRVAEARAKALNQPQKVAA